jgi:hypothetical protein
LNSGLPSKPLAIFRRSPPGGAAFRLLEADERAHAARRLDLGQLDLVDLLGAGSGLLGFRGVGREAADEGLQLGDLRFLLGVVRQQLLADWVAAVMYSS